MSAAQNWIWPQSPYLRETTDLSQDGLYFKMFLQCLRHNSVPTTACEFEVKSSVKFCIFSFRAILYRYPAILFIIGWRFYTWGLTMPAGQAEFSKDLDLVRNYYFLLPKFKKTFPRRAYTLRISFVFRGRGTQATVAHRLTMINYRL